MPILLNKIGSDPYKKGEYIFTWLSDIVSFISRAFAEEEVSEEEVPQARVVPLYELAACAGDGFPIDDSIPHSDISDLSGIADYAVTISGNSMEPTIMDNTVVFVKKEAAPEHNTIGLFIVNGDVQTLYEARTRI